MQMVHQAETNKETMVAIEGPAPKKESSSIKRGAPATAPKAPKAKKPKKGPGSKDNGNASVQRAKTVKKSVEVSINGVDMDINGILIPVCTCTGTPKNATDGVVMVGSLLAAP